MRCGKTNRNPLLKSRVDQFDRLSDQDDGPTLFQGIRLCLSSERILFIVLQLSEHCDCSVIIPKIGSPTGRGFDRDWDMSSFSLISVQSHC
jgi:hypothetical protein